MSFRGKIRSLVGTLLCIILVISSYASYRVLSLSRDLQELARHDFRLMQSVSSLWATSLQQRLVLEKTLRTEDLSIEEIDGLADDYFVFADSIRTTLESISMIIVNHEGEKFSRFTLPLDSLINHYETFITLGESVFSQMQDETGGSIRRSTALLDTVQNEIEQSVAGMNKEIELIVESSSDTALENQRSALLFMLIVAGTGIAIGLVLALTVTAGIVRQLGADPREVEIIARRISHGDLRAGIRGGDEKGIMRSMLRMTEDLRSLVGQIGASARNTELRNSRLETSSAETAAAVVQISDNISSLGEQIEVLAESIVETDRAVNSIMSVIEELNRQATEQSTAAAQSGTAVKQISASVEGIRDMVMRERSHTSALLRSVSEGRQKLQATTKIIGEVSANAQDIRGVIALIDDIADQTSILSLNASIQAAHAGAAGRGFGVVAVEIRKLAEAAHRNAEAIREKLQQNDQAVDGLAERAHETLSFYDLVEGNATSTGDAFTEVANAMDELNTGTGEIVEAVSSLSSASSEIRSKSSEIKSGIQIIHGSSRKVNAASGAVDDAMNEIRSSTSHINQTLRELDSAVHAIRDSVEEIRSELGMFQLMDDEDGVPKEEESSEPDGSSPQ